MAKMIIIPRVIGGLVLGIVTGIICLIGNLPNIPIGSIHEGFLVVAMWQRIIMGLTIGLIPGQPKLIGKAPPLVNAIIRGAIIGLLFSVHLAFFTAIFSYKFLLAGIVFGAAIDGILEILPKK